MAIATTVRAKAALSYSTLFFTISRVFWGPELG